MTDILAIIIEAAKDYSHNWLLAASLPPALYYLTKKRKQSWLQKFFMKWVMKRAAKRARKGKKMSDGLLTFLVLIGLLGLGALMIWLLGLGTTLLILLIIVILVACWKFANPKEYD